jgi:ribosomal protein S18 acetylase RimI-like enzyme
MREFPIMTGISTVQRLTVEELHAAAADDVMVSSETRGGALAAWGLDGGFAFAAADDYTGSACWLSVVGNPQAAPALVDAALADLGERIAGLTVPRGVPLATWNADPPPGEHDDSAWDMMACTTPPPAQADDARVVPLGDLTQVQDFLDRVNPQHSVRADYELVDLWAGVRDEDSGALLAVGALTRRLSGIAYLASIATDPAARGQGLGSAVTGVLTRRVFDGGEQLCTLAHYHPNDSARRIYLRLGYRTTHQFCSGRILR